MAALTIGDFQASYTVTQGELVTALQSAGIRCEQLMRALPVAEGDFTGTILAYDDYAGTYSFSNSDFLKSTLARLGPRGWSFFTVMQPYKV